MIKLILFKRRYVFPKLFGFVCLICFELSFVCFAVCIVFCNVKFLIIDFLMDIIHTIFKTLNIIGDQFINTLLTIYGGCCAGIAFRDNYFNIEEVVFVFLPGISTILIIKFGKAKTNERIDIGVNANFNHIGYMFTSN